MQKRKILFIATIFIAGTISYSYSMQAETLNPQDISIIPGSVDFMILRYGQISNYSRYLLYTLQRYPEKYDCIPKKTHDLLDKSLYYATYFDCNKNALKTIDLNGIQDNPIPYLQKRLDPNTRAIVASVQQDYAGNLLYFYDAKGKIVFSSDYLSQKTPSIANLQKLFREFINVDSIKPSDITQVSWEEELFCNYGCTIF